MSHVREMQGTVQAHETHWCQGGLVSSIMFMRGRSMAERTTKAFQRQDQRIYKLPGPLIKKQVPKVLSPKGKQESQGPFSRCLLIIPEDPRWVFQPCSASNTLPEMYNMRLRWNWKMLGPSHPWFTSQTRQEIHQIATLERNGMGQLGEDRAEEHNFKSWRAGWAGHFSSCAFLYL